MVTTATATRCFTTEHSRSCISVAQSAMLLPFGMCSARPDRKLKVHRQCWHTYARRTHGVVSETPLLRTRRCSGFVIRRSGFYARGRSSQGKGAYAVFRAAPSDRAREICSNEFAYALRRALGVDQFLAGCPRCPRGRENEINTTLDARTCHHDGAQSNMHEPLKFALSKALKHWG